MEERNKKIIFALVVVAAVVVMASRIDSSIPDISSRTTTGSAQADVQLDTEILIDETEQSTETEEQTDIETESETEPETTAETADEPESETGDQKTAESKTVVKPAVIRSAVPAIKTETSDESESESEQLQNLTVDEELASEKTYDEVKTAYAADNINIRQRPGRDDDISVLDSYYKGETVILYGETQNWYVVQVDGTDQKGYVSKEFISDEKVAY